MLLSQYLCTLFFMEKRYSEKRIVARGVEVERGVACSTSSCGLQIVLSNPTQWLNFIYGFCILHLTHTFWSQNNQFPNIPNVKRWQDLKRIFFAWKLIYMNPLSRALKFSTVISL